MSALPLRREITIANPQGLHMRPATIFASRAGKYESAVTLSKGDKRVNGKSPLELLFLAAESGSVITLEVDGSDAAEAVETLSELLAAPSVDDMASSGPLPNA
jgi:phosphotransferase system HPr (HPr) family protein